MAIDTFSSALQNQSTQPTGFTQPTDPTAAGIYSPGVINNNNVGMAQNSYQPVMAPVYTPPTIGSLDKNSLQNYTFQFNDDAYLNAYKSQSESIYGPQKAQLESLRKLNESKVDQTRIRTKEDFARRMTQEVEAINARGAFFQGGALNRQGNIARDESYAMQDINLQALADNANFLAQQGALSAEQANWISQQFAGAKGSAYDQFLDQRNFYTDLYKQKVAEKQWKKEYKLSKKAAKSKKNNKYTFDYNINKPTDFNINHNTSGGGSDPLAALRALGIDV